MWFKKKEEVNVEPILPAVAVFSMTGAEKTMNLLVKSAKSDDPHIAKVYADAAFSLSKAIAKMADVKSRTKEVG